MASAEVVSELEALFERAADENRLVAMEELRAETGAGHEDLTAALDELRTAGKAIEETPGEWRGAYLDEAASLRRGPAAAASREPQEAPARPRARTAAADVGTDVRLTFGIAAALNEESLGAIVKAGIDEAAASGAPFTLTVS